MITNICTGRDLLNAKNLMYSVFKDMPDQIEHSEEVALSSPYLDEQVVGYLHDVVEDTSTTIEDLQEMFPEQITTAVSLLTRNPEQQYFDYITKLIESGNGLALNVKYHDLKHNSKRCVTNPEKKSLLKRYVKALSMISDYIRY